MYSSEKKKKITLRQTEILYTVFPVWPRSRCKIKERKRQMGPLKRHSNTLVSSLNCVCRFTHFRDIFFSKNKQTFSSVFLHVLVVGLLSGVARMELCDTARTPDILQ